MNKLFQILTLVILSLISQQSQSQPDQVLDINHLNWVAQTATVGERVRVTITRTKAKLHLPKSQKLVIRAKLDDSDDDYYDEVPEFQVGYRRPELVKVEVVDNHNLTDEIKLRLAVARLKALKKYQEVWG